jgi:hypothetical protein
MAPTQVHDAMHGRARRPVSASRLGSFDERGSKVQQGQVTYWYPIVCVLVKRDSDEPLNALKMAFGERCNSIIGRRWPLIVIYFPFVKPPIPAHRDELGRLRVEVGVSVELPGDPGLEVAVHVLVGHQPKAAGIAPDLGNKFLHSVQVVRSPTIGSM